MCFSNTRFTCKIISALYIWHIKAGKVYTLEIVSLWPQLKTVLAPVSYWSSRCCQRKHLFLNVPNRASRQNLDSVLNGKQKTNPQNSQHFWPCAIFFIKLILQELMGFTTLGRVVRKPVNVNPGLSVSCSIIYYRLRMFFISNVWCSLILLQLKTAGQTI